MTRVKEWVGVIVVGARLIAPVLGELLDCDSLFSCTGAVMTLDADGVGAVVHAKLPSAFRAQACPSSAGPLELREIAACSLEVSRVRISVPVLLSAMPVAARGRRKYPLGAIVVDEIAPSCLTV